jgi:hypothetical protein
MEIGSNFLVDLGQMDKEYFPNISGLSFKVSKNKTKANMMYKMTKRLLIE